MEEEGELEEGELEEGELEEVEVERVEANAAAYLPSQGSSPESVHRAPSQAAADNIQKRGSKRKRGGRGRRRRGKARQEYPHNGACGGSSFANETHAEQCLWQGRLQYEDSRLEVTASSVPLRYWCGDDALMRGSQPNQRHEALQARQDALGRALPAIIRCQGYLAPGPHQGSDPMPALGAAMPAVVPAGCCVLLLRAASPMSEPALREIGQQLLSAHAAAQIDTARGAAYLMPPFSRDQFRDMTAYPHLPDCSMSPERGSRMQMALLLPLADKVTPPLQLRAHLSPHVHMGPAYESRPAHAGARATANGYHTMASAYPPVTAVSQDDMQRIDVTARFAGARDSDAQVSEVLGLLLQKQGQCDGAAKLPFVVPDHPHHALFMQRVQQFRHQHYTTKAAAAAAKAAAAACAGAVAVGASIARCEAVVLRVRMDRAIWGAFKHGDFGPINALLELGVPVDFKRSSAEGATALIAAAYQGALGEVTALIARGATVDVQDASGYTAATIAAMRGHEKVAAFLRSVEQRVEQAR